METSWRQDGKHRGVVIRNMAVFVTYLSRCRYMPDLPVMARDCGVSLRTVYRYINALEEAHCPMPMRRTDDC